MTVKLLLTWNIITGREQEYFEFVVREAMQRVLKTDEWASLVNRLLDYVENYNAKVVKARAGFQL